MLLIIRVSSCVQSGVHVKYHPCFIVDTTLFPFYAEKKSMAITHQICDMIKRNESDVADVVFEILAKTVFKFRCFILVLALSNPS